MRRCLSFTCLGETLIGTIDDAPGATGLLIVTGGRQTRIGPHRMMAALARDLAVQGFPVFRFDRRGVGDSSGSDPGFEASAADIAAAAATLRTACPQIEQLWGLGLCDGASALAKHHAAIGLSGLILLNPWVVETEAGKPPPAAIRAHYRERLFTIAGWRKLLTQGFDPFALARGLVLASHKPDQSLANDVMTSLSAFSGPVSILLAARDATARAFLNQYHGRSGAALRRSAHATIATLDSASHSFAASADQRWLLSQIVAALQSRD